MSGLGRRTHYRKHLTDSTLHNLPIPNDNECIAKIVSTRGGNQFDIVVADDESPHLAILPTKFHKLVWVKRNDYVIVETGVTQVVSDDKSKEEGGVRFMISHILYKDQVKHLKNERLWPDDERFSSGHGSDDAQTELVAQDDGIVYNDYAEELEDDLLFANTNRVNNLQIAESSSDESSEEE